MVSRIVDTRQERTTRDLRLRIGRLRRRIDARIRAAENETRRLTSWRTYVKNYPVSAILGALGVGLALSAGLSARRLSTPDASTAKNSTAKDSTARNNAASSNGAEDGRA